MAMGDLWASLTTARPCPRTALPPIFSDRARQLSRTSRNWRPGNYIERAAAPGHACSYRCEDGLVLALIPG
jgi:hypothetical protein